jgi:type I restriction-modification system DNA methylase subunit
MTKNQDESINQIYETSLSMDDRKTQGIYYTPHELVRFMINLVFIKKDSKILEAGCGVGNFVIPLIKKLNKIYNQTETSNKTLQKILSNNIFALDFDPNAVEILKNSINVPSPNIESSSFLSQTSFDNNKYDVVIGNPPYNAKLSKKEKDYCKTHYPDISETIRSETFFVIKNIDLLKSNGQLCLVLPATILRVNHYSGLRSFILEKCNVEKIIDLKRAFDFVGYETIILLLRKKKSKNTNVEVITGVKNLEKKQFDKHLLQHNFLEKRDVMPMWISNDLIPLIEKIEKNSVKLSSISKNKRGISIASTDKKYLSEENESKSLKILRGKDIGRYKIKPVQKYLLKNSKWDNFVKIRATPKIIVQNLAYRIVATYDKQHMVLDTVNTVILNNNDFDLKYILAILNSQLMNFYFRYVISNKAALNIHLDEVYLGELPIRKNQKYQKELVKLVNLALKSNGKDKEILQKIDDTVYKIYGISKKDQQKISLM